MYGARARAHAHTHTHTHTNTERVRERKTLLELKTQAMSMLRYKEFIARLHSTCRLPANIRAEVEVTDSNKHISGLHHNTFYGNNSFRNVES